MSAFDLEWFRRLAFGRAPLPDHPAHGVQAARGLVGGLAQEPPERQLAELTYWTAAMNAADSFTPGRRARVLMVLDDAARPAWRSLGASYLAPYGRPWEGREGDAALLKALADSAAQFADGFAIAVDARADSGWVREHLPRLLVRNMRWLARRLALAYMLKLPQSPAIWERLHRLHGIAAEHGVLRNGFPAYEGVRFNTSPAREYLRPLLLELANPSALGPREVELVYRVAARTASAASLSAEDSTDAAFAVCPGAAARPGHKGLVARPGVQALYIATANCLPRLRTALERGMGGDGADEDSLFGRGFTVRERRRVIEWLLRHWGMDPPRRRAARVAMPAPVRVVAGFDNILGVLGAVREPAGRAGGLSLELSDSEAALKAARVRAGRDCAGRLVDASTGGLGIAVRAADAPWAQHGALLAVLVEPGRDWAIGVLRRVFAVEDELRLGVQLLARAPRVLTLRDDTAWREDAWAEAKLFEDRFAHHYPRAILCEPDALPLAGGHLLFSPGVASRGSQFNVPQARGEQRIRVTRLADANAHFERAVFEPLGEPAPAAQPA